MRKYFYCGQKIISNIAIPELSCPSYEHGDVSIIFLATQQHSKDAVWTRYWVDPDGEKMLLYRQEDRWHWLRFPELADFRISENARQISCYPLSEMPEETIRHLLLDQVMPRCLAHQGRVMLHASAIRFEDGLVLFIGNSGAGKSTLAGNFHLLGNPAVSDDCVCIEMERNEIVAIPSYGGLRLWEDSLQVLFSAKQNTQLMSHYSAKKRVQLNDSGTVKGQNGRQILAVFLLSPQRSSSELDINLEVIPRREGFIEIANQTFQLDSYDYSERNPQMQALALLVKRVPMYRLFMPHDYALLPKVRQRILEELGSLKKMSPYRTKAGTM